MLRFFISSAQNELATGRAALRAHLEPLATAAWLERTIPDKPTKPSQLYHLTQKGRAWLAKTQQPRQQDKVASSE